MELIQKGYAQQLAERALLHPDRDAIVMGDERVTYAQLTARLDRVAATLLSAGLKKGDKVVLWSVACPMWLIAYYGIIRAGGVAVVLNANLTLKDAVPLADFADTVMLLYGKTHDTAGTAAEAAGLAEAFHLDAGGVFSLAETDFEQASFPLPDVSGWDIHDDAYIIYTSGTTAFPKAVLTSQFGIVNAAAHLTEAISSRKGDRAVMAVPLFHAYGIMVSWIYLSNGGTILIP